MVVALGRVCRRAAAIEHIGGSSIVDAGCTIAASTSQLEHSTGGEFSLSISGVTGLSDIAAILRTVRTGPGSAPDPDIRTHDVSSTTAPRGARQIVLHARQQEERHLLRQATIRR
ncbi:hypothetical protein [Krasilnikovia cinnamomea]|uniref:hypothetical protein n=1 Tax=Krasilnikovia cinnamomea TaxID=349313 RepID=UPI00102CDCDA|nr:hypothetical protein [Krasilnikovia cinnamomea]